MFATKDDKIRLPLAVYLSTPRATSGLVRREAKTNYVLPSHNQLVKTSQAFRNYLFFLTLINTCSWFLSQAQTHVLMWNHTL